MNKNKIGVRIFSVAVILGLIIFINIFILKYITRDDKASMKPFVSSQPQAEGQVLPGASSTGDKMAGEEKGKRVAPKWKPAKPVVVFSG